MVFSKRWQEKMHGPERRFHWRVQPNGKLRVQFKKKGWFAPQLEGQIFNISEEGIFLTTNKRVPLGSRITISLNLPGGFPSSQPFICKADVIRVLYDQQEKEYGIACRLIMLSPQEAEKIRQLMWWFELNCGEPQLPSALPAS